MVDERSAGPVSAASCLRLDDGRAVLAVHVDDLDAVGGALGALGLDRPRPAVVLVGGAGGLGGSHAEQVRSAFSSGLVPAVEGSGAAALDGGTRSGVMQVLGESRTEAGASFPLVGVVATGTVTLPGEPAAREHPAELDPGHTHVLLVPGEEWGDESPWLARAATELTGASPSVTVLVNGGEIAYRDVAHSVAAGRPVLVVEGSGRTADELAAALRGHPADARAVDLVRSGLVRAVPVDDPASLLRLVAGALRGP